MKICTACDKELTKKSFDADQWLMDEMMCRECIGAGRVAQPNVESSNKIQGQSDAGICYLCLGEGLDDSGQPLRRDCSCRNGAGHAHLSCLVSYAEHRSINEGDCRPWRKCPNCLHFYQGELAIDLATEQVAFFSREYPDNELYLLSAMIDKLLALQIFGQPKEAEEFAHRMIVAIDQAKARNNSPSSESLLGYEANVHRVLGLIALQKDNDGTKAAVGHLEKSRDLFNVLGDDFNFDKTEAERSVALAKDACGEGKMSVGKRLKMEDDFFLVCIKKFGREGVQTIEQGMNLALYLSGANRHADAMVILAALYIVSRRAHGPDHRVTKSVESYIDALSEASGKGNGKSLIDIITINGRIKRTCLWLLTGVWLVVLVWIYF